MIVLAVGRNSR